MTLPDLPNAISSPELESGPTPCVALGGLTIEEFGQVLAPANLSARQAKAAGLMTSGIYGPHGSTLSRNADRSALLANRLQAKMDSDGSPLFKLTWKARDMIRGGSICALRASAHRISASEFIGWPTPRTPTGGAESSERKKELGRLNSGGGDLQAVAKLAAWNTPRATDGSNGGPNQAGGALSHDASLTASWATPTTRDHKDGSSIGTVETNGLLGRQAWLTFGQMPNGSPAPMEKTGQLNPAHSRWLMGLPREWDACADMAMLLLRRWPKRLLK